MSEDRKLTRTLIVEVPAKKKARYVATASRDGMKLNDWIIGTLDDNAWFDDERAPGNIREDILDRHGD